MNGTTPRTAKGTKRLTRITTPRRPLTGLRPVALSALLAVLLPAAAGRADVKVERKPAEVEVKTYDPKDPPKNVHGLGHHESGLTVSEFGCKIGLSIAPGVPRPQRDGKCQEALVIQQVKMTTELKITIWLPDNANDKLKAHEQGHREMTEKVYDDRAEKAARAAAVLIDGRRFTAEAENCDAIDKAVEQTIGAANKKVYDAYLAQTADLSARAGEIYDEITAHGRNVIDEKTAAAQAFAKQAEEAKKAPAGTTRPGAQSPPRATNPPSTREILPK